ncbi:MAG: dihydrodipicolinate synthase family protein [Chloroflexota bacterium]
MPSHPISGVFAAAITPLEPNGRPDLTAIPSLLTFLAQRGCHGALILGTTGEGPSFSSEERTAILRAALVVRKSHPDFILLAGTGTPSLSQTISLTRSAFDMGFDGVVVLPPYYFRAASQEGLFTWYKEVLDQAVPSSGALLGYHFPQMSGVTLSTDLLSRLKEAYPNNFVGLKDSSGDLNYTQFFSQRFGKDFAIHVGKDSLFSQALETGAAGCITALANLCSPDARLIWDAHQAGGSAPQAQGRLTAARSVMDSYPPAASLIKGLMSRRHQFPSWAVRPPLMPLPPNIIEKADAELQAIY